MVGPDGVTSYMVRKKKIDTHATMSAIGSEKRREIFGEGGVQYIIFRYVHLHLEDNMGKLDLVYKFANIQDIKTDSLG